MRMIIGLKISDMWHLLGESLAYIFRFKFCQRCNDCLVRSVVQNRIWIPLPLLLGEKGWRSAESTLFPPIWPGLLVLSLAPSGFSPGTPVFPSPQKPTLANSNSIWNARTRLNEFLRTPKYLVGKQITIYNFWTLFGSGTLITKLRGNFFFVEIPKSTFSKKRRIHWFVYHKLSKAGVSSTILLDCLQSLFCAWSVEFVDC